MSFFNVTVFPSNKVQTDFPVFIRVNREDYLDKNVSLRNRDNSSGYKLKLSENKSGNFYEAQLSFAIPGTYEIEYGGEKSLIEVSEGGWLPFNVEFPLYMGGAAIIVLFLAWRYLIRTKKVPA